MKNNKSLVLVSVLALLSLLLAACGSKKEANMPFPTGKLINSEHPDRGLVFNADGTSSAYANLFGSETTLVVGTYVVDGDSVTDTPDDPSCPPVSLKYTFDGTYLTFNYIGDPADDPCGVHRRPAFDSVTYSLSK